jgi:hypothetical protein
VLFRTGISRREFLIHFTTGLVYLLFPLLLPIVPNGKAWEYPVRYLSTFFLLFLFFELHYHWIIPKFYFRKKYILYLLILISCFYLIYILPKLLFPHHPFHHYHHHSHHHHQLHHEPWHHGAIRSGQMFLLYSFLISVAASLLLQTQNRLRAISEEKTKSELDLLKAQINPHFLFNTINAIYALTLKSSSEAPQALIKLSGIMRYLVTESTTDLIALSRELDYLRDYVELQRLRTDERSGEISFSVEGDPASKKLPPMLLVPFVENAFKFGINPDKTSGIRIHVRILSDRLEFEVDNSIVNETDPSLMGTETGILNTQKRLEYYFPGRYDLSMQNTAGFYQTKLSFPLV